MMKETKKNDACGGIDFNELWINDSAYTVGTIRMSIAQVNRYHGDGFSIECGNDLLAFITY